MKQKVHVIIKTESKDYHGTYEEIVSIHGDQQDAQNKVNKLIEENFDYDTDYYYETYDVE